MASKFLKSNFKSMNMTEEEKNAYAEAAAKQAANTMRKSITGISGAVSEKEMEFLSKSIPKNLRSIIKLKKLLEEEKQ